jgi:hypothetical protein
VVNYRLRSVRRGDLVADEALLLVDLTLDRVSTTQR